MFLLIDLECFCFIHAKNIYLGQFNLDILFHNILFFCFLLPILKDRTSVCISRTHVSFLKLRFEIVRWWNKVQLWWGLDEVNLVLRGPEIWEITRQQPNPLARGLLLTGRGKQRRRPYRGVVWRWVQNLEKRNLNINPSNYHNAEVQLIERAVEKCLDLLPLFKPVADLNKIDTK